MTDPSERSEQTALTAGLPIAIEARIAGQIAPSSKRTYTNDMQHFHRWLDAQGHPTLTEMTVQAAHTLLADYRGYIALTYVKGATAQRMFAIACRVIDEAYTLGLLLLDPDHDGRHVAPGNPAKAVRGIKADNATPAPALETSEAKTYLEAFNKGTLRGLVEYTIAATLLYTGLRRAELAALNVGDLTTEHGHSVLVVRAGKGNKRRVVKVKTELRRWLDEYLGRLRAQAGYQELYQNSSLDEIPLFVTIQRKGYLFHRTTDKTIYRIVKRTTARATVRQVSPHGLRSTFATTALEHAQLHKVRQALGHKDARTTERYDRQFNNLDDNAVDKVAYIQESLPIYREQ